MDEMDEVDEMDERRVFDPVRVGKKRKEREGRFTSHGSFDPWLRIMDSYGVLRQTDTPRTRGWSLALRLKRGAIGLEDSTDATRESKRSE